MTPTDTTPQTHTPDLLEALKGLSPLDSGYCFCSRADDAPDYRHATACRAARQAIARAEAPR